LATVSMTRLDPASRAAAHGWSDLTIRNVFIIPTILFLIIFNVFPLIYSLGTSFTDYALRVLIYAAARPESRCLTADVATAFGISRHHVVKVVHLLGKEGLLANSRGRGGGLRLARTAASINVGHVVRITERPTALVECFAPTGNCAITNACRLAGALQQAHEAFYEVLDRFTLADLLVRPQRITQILHYPSEQRQ